MTLLAGFDWPGPCRTRWSFALIRWYKYRRSKWTLVTLRVDESSAVRVWTHRRVKVCIHFNYFIILRITLDMDARPMGHSGLAQG